MKRVVITLVTVCVLSLVAVAPTFADHWNNCGGRHYQGYGGYSRQTFYPGGYGGYRGYAVPGRVVVGYRSVGGISGYDPYGGYSNFNNYNYGYSNYGNAYGNYPNGGYGYNSTPSFGFYFSR